MILLASAVWKEEMEDKRKLAKIENIIMETLMIPEFSIVPSILLSNIKQYVK
jgi:hypothetical protein